MSQKILVADDNLAVQRLISATLREKGVEVLAVSTGPAALTVLETVQDDPPCLILADFNLEGMHLFTFVRKVQQDDRFAEIPVIALIHAIDSYDSVHLASVGIRDILKKPLHVEALLKTVEIYLPLRVAPAVLPQEIVPPPIVPAMETAEDVPTATKVDSRTAVQEDAADRLTEGVGMAVADPPGFNPEPWPEPWPEEIGPALPDLPQTTETVVPMDGVATMGEPPDPTSPADEAAPPDATEVVRTHVAAEMEEAVTRAVRQLLPGFLEAALTQEVIQTALQTALEKVAREVVLPLAEAEIIKEIKRLQPEESL